MPVKKNILENITKKEIIECANNQMFQLSDKEISDILKNIEILNEKFIDSFINIDTDNISECHSPIRNISNILREDIASKIENNEKYLKNSKFAKNSKIIIKNEV
jgi:Asp-tRNA(Asn)/Glu-tRNA(Gln) amidotransferase C subunit